MLLKIISYVVNPRPKSLNPVLFCAFSHNAQDLDEEWYRAAYAKLIKLTRLLKNLEKVNGKVIHKNNGSIVTNTHVITEMQSFDALAKAFINKSHFAEINSVTLNSLTKVCNLLNISAQQRKSVRLKICTQVTQHHIWRGALEEALQDLEHEMEHNMDSNTQSFQMGKQIISSCLKFFTDMTCTSNSESPSWMKPAPLRRVERVTPLHTWGEVLEMFVDLSKCLENEAHTLKIEAMKEGLYQIKDIVIERDVSYKEVRRQDCLVKRNLSKSLGHSSKCLFALLVYYLYGSVCDIEIEVCRQDSRGGGRFCIEIGKVVSCCDEGMVMNGVKEMSRAVGVFRFVWESAEMEGVLEVKGHVWCVGGEEGRISYRGNEFFVHGFRV